MSLANLFLGPKLIPVSSGVTISPASIEHEFLENAAFIFKKPCGGSDHDVSPQSMLPLNALPLISRPLVNAGKLARARTLSQQRFIER